MKAKYQKKQAAKVNVQLEAGRITFMVALVGVIALVLLGLLATV